MKDKITKLFKYLKENIYFFLTLIFLIVLLNVKLPYSIYSPGGVINVDKRLVGSPYKNEGELFLTYVTFSEGKIPNLLLALILPEWDIVKNSDVTYDDETLEELNLKDRIRLFESISNATYLAYTKANIPLSLTAEASYVISIADYANTNIKVGDKIMSVEGIKIHDFNDILNIINEHDFNDKLELKIMRGEKEHDCYAYINDDSGEKRIGIGVSKVNEYQTLPNIEYKYKSNESGPSGGLMLSLALYNSLIESDITKGYKISGTGTIAIDGTVGEISGIKYKLSGAVKNKSDVFIVPSANYEEALNEKKKHNYSIKIIEAKTFDQVLEELSKL